MSCSENIDHYCSIENSLTFISFKLSIEFKRSERNKPIPLNGLESSEIEGL
jgi:hypothetical protein